MLEEGQRAILKVGSGGHMYVVKVEEVGEDVLILSAPIRLGQVVPVRPGTGVEVQYHRKDAMYGFHTTVREFRPGHLPLISVARPEEIRRIQRREHVRWPVSLPVTVTAPGGKVELDGRVLDLSGGGMAVSLPGQRDWQQGEEVQVRLHLRPDRPGEAVEACARVVRTWNAEPSAPGRPPSPRRQRVALEFTRIAPSAREAIIRYIFARQREFLRAGLTGHDRGAGG
jgi:c-di-GMP-binding flagellar brake protein YcgR